MNKNSSDTDARGKALANNGTPAAPSISVPKGGGAIRGIGEKFVANPVTGTASLNVPISLSPCRSDFSPQLSLSYDSGAGNGPFGLGWGVSIPALTRKTDKGLPRYQDEDDWDTFLLLESEDLVPALIGNNGSWSKDAFDITLDGATYTVQRYRPRVEASFARIEKILVHGEAGCYWKVTTKENVVTIFGRTALARIADPADPSRIYKGLADWSYDDKGNCIEYFHKAENPDAVPLVLNERNRRSGLAPVTNQYLKQVSYGNKNPYHPDRANPYKGDRPANLEYFFATLFDYGEHDEPAPSPIEVNPWRYRFDPFSDYRAGFEVRTQRLCRRILTFHFFIELNVGTSPALEPCLVRSLDLSYRHFKFDNGAFINQEADFITAIKQVSYKKTGANAYQAKSLPAMELSYHELEWNKEVKTISRAELVNAPVGIGANYQWVDLLNEGVSGILSEQANGWYYKSKLGGGRFSSGRQVAPKPSFVGVATGSLQFQDLDANGMKQLVINDPGPQGYFELDNVDRWSEFRFFDRVPNVNLNDPNTKYIDLNNDGKPELVISERSIFQTTIRCTPS